MNGRRETGLKLSVSEVFNVGFLRSGVTRACLNAVGQCGLQQRKMKVETDRYSGITNLLIYGIFHIIVSLFHPGGILMCVLITITVEYFQFQN